MDMMAGKGKGGVALGLDLETIYDSIKLRSLVAMSQGAMTEDILKELVTLMNN